MVYVDASFLVALLSREATAELAAQWLSDHAEVDLCSADWCMTEVASALSIKVRTSQLRQLDADDAWSHFERACGGLIRLEVVLAEDFSAAAQLCRVANAGLGAGDGLHLAVARRLQCRALLSLDKNLNLNAQASGLEIVTL